MYGIWKGVAIGDGCVGTSVICGVFGTAKVRTDLFQADFLYGHGQISHELYTRIQQSCHPFYDYDPEETKRKEIQRKLDDQCQSDLEEMNKQAGFFFPYGLYDE